jgi:hypothetical protein
VPAFQAKRERRSVMAVIDTVVDAIVQEFEQESATTRRLLERVPADQLAWKPHPKSMSLGELALHIAQGPDS